MHPVAFRIIQPFIIIELFIERCLLKIRGWLTPPKRTTYGEFYNKHRRDSKKELIRNILVTTGAINKNPGYVDPEFKKELRSTGRRALLRALCMLQIAYTKKLQKA